MIALGWLFGQFRFIRFDSPPIDGWRYVPAIGSNVFSFGRTRVGQGSSTGLKFGDAASYVKTDGSGDGVIWPTMRGAFSDRSGYAILLPHWLLLSVSLVPTAFFWWRASRWRPATVCPKCEYELGPDPAAGCPECGHGRRES